MNTKVHGHLYDDFAEGRVFEHHWGRTVTESDTVLFSTMTQSYNPLYFNAAFARAHGHDGIVANPLLVFGIVFGLSVQDLSERGGPFLGIEDLSFHTDVFPGDTLTARSTVLSKRLSSSREGWGIVTWHTEGFNQDGVRVIDFRRSNLIPQR